jgi:hypothetical protein
MIWMRAHSELGGHRALSWVVNLPDGRQQLSVVWSGGAAPVVQTTNDAVNFACSRADQIVQGAGHVCGHGCPAWRQILPAPPRSALNE